MRQRIFSYVLLAMAAALTLASGIPVVRVYSSGAALASICGLPAAVCAWGYLALSKGRRRDFALAIGLNLLTVWFLCRALGDLADCYAYYAAG